MTRKLFRSLMILMVIATVSSLVLAACGAPAAARPAATTAPAAPAATTAPAAPAAPAVECTAVGSGATIGISMSDFATERWKPEATLLQQLLEAKGYKVLLQEANRMM